MYDSIQDLRAFSEKVFDAVQEYLADGEIVDNEGIYVDDNLKKSIIKDTDTTDTDNYYPIKTLIREEDGNVEPDVDNIDDVASHYFFVR